MKEDVPIPDRLKKFPLYKGMLIHFTVFVGDDGVPDFKVVHELARMKCMVNGLCNLCGEKLGEEMVFIGGDKSIQSGVFMDGPMHSDCAMYAIKVCPYLKDETWEHAKRQPRHLGQKDTIFKTADAVAIGRPKMGVYYTDGYEIIESGDSLYFQAAMPFYVKWDLMPQPQERPHEDEKGKTALVGE